MRDLERGSRVRGTWLKLKRNSVGKDLNSDFVADAMDFLPGWTAEKPG